MCKKFSFRNFFFYFSYTKKNFRHVFLPTRYNLIEHSYSFLKTYGILWYFYRYVPTLVDEGEIVDFTEANTTDSFNIKEILTGDNGTKNVEKLVPLKYLSNLWRSLEMPLINCEITLDLNWSENCIIVATNAVNQSTTFSVTDTKHYVPVVTLSTQDNAKLLEQPIRGFKRTINWNKYQPKLSTKRPNQYLDFSVDPILHWVNRLFVLSFENKAQRISGKRYYLPTRELKNYNVIIDGQNFFDQLVRNYLITYDNIRKITTGQGNDCANGCLLDYDYFNKYYKMIAIDLSKQQAINADPKTIQQINFTRNLEEQSTIFFTIEEAKESVLHFSQGPVKVSQFYLWY